MATELKLDSEHRGEGILRLKIAGVNIMIGDYHIDFFNKLKALPANIKIPLVQLTAEEMENYIVAEKARLH